MPLNLFEDQFIKHWKSLDFSTWNESDVREDFIAPLLKLLGYAKNTVDHIIREPTLALDHKYHRIGRSQIAIDYIPTVRLKKFWIIEAKPGNPKEMAFGDLLQAHFYAIHPEVGARFMVMINGWEIRVYDAQGSGSWDDHICCCTQENCDSTFEELADLLGSKSMTTALRKYILSTVRESLLVEVDIQKAEELRTEVLNIYRECYPAIQKNVRDLQVESFKKAESEEKEWLKNMSLEHLWIFMDRPTDARGMYGMELVRRLTELDEKGRYALYRMMIQKCYGRPHNVFRVQCIVALGHMLEVGLEVCQDGQPVNILKDLTVIATYNMAYWLWPVGNPMDQISHALCHLDNICARMAYKFSRRFGMEPLRAIVNAQHQAFAVEDLLVSRPSLSKAIVGSVRIIHEMLWFKFRSQDSRQIWEDIWNLEETEKILDTIPQVDYTDGEADFLWFGEYGVSFDMLRVGTWTELKTLKDTLVKAGASSELFAIMELSREEVKKIPPTLKRPDNWAFRPSVPIDGLAQLLRDLHTRINQK